LRGNPARSRDEEGEVAGQIIEYDLDSNDVVVRQGVEATFDLDLEGDDPALPSFGGSDADTDTGDVDGPETDEPDIDDDLP
jgi:hypothetical protein